MESKPIKSADPKPETVISLQQKIIRLQIQIDGLKNKVLKLENKALKQEQKIIKLQAENERLKKEINTPYNQAQLHADIMAIKELNHLTPPEK